MGNEVTHRRYKCEEDDCDTQIWVAKETLEVNVRERGLVCPCTMHGSDLVPVPGPEGEVRL